jgi:hypothetical protein
VNLYKLLSIDEIGYLPLAREQANLFFQVVEHRRGWRCAGVFPPGAYVVARQSEVRHGAVLAISVLLSRSETDRIAAADIPHRRVRACPQG